MAERRSRGGQPETIEEFLDAIGVERLIEEASPEQKRKLQKVLGMEEGEEPETSERFIATTEPGRANTKFDSPAELIEDTLNGLLEAKGVETAKIIGKTRQKNNVSKVGTGRRENVQAIRKVPGDIPRGRREEEPRHQGE